MRERLATARDGSGTRRYAGPLCTQRAPSVCFVRLVAWTLNATRTPETPKPRTPRAGRQESHDEGRWAPGGGGPAHLLSTPEYPWRRSSSPSVEYPGVPWHTLGGGPAHSLLTTQRAKSARYLPTDLSTAVTALQPKRLSDPRRAWLRSPTARRDSAHIGRALCGRIAHGVDARAAHAPRCAARCEQRTDVACGALGAP